MFGSTTTRLVLVPGREAEVARRLACRTGELFFAAGADERLARVFPSSRPELGAGLELVEYAFFRHEADCQTAIGLQADAGRGQGPPTAHSSRNCVGLHAKRQIDGEVERLNATLDVGIRARVINAIAVCVPITGDNDIRFVDTGLSEREVEVLMAALENRNRVIRCDPV